MRIKFWKRKEAIVFYAAGPGNVVDTFKHWSSGEEDPLEMAKTYSGAFYSFARELEIQALVVSSHHQKARDSKFGIDVRNLPSAFPCAKSIFYHLNHLVYGLRLLALILRSGASTVFLTEGMLPAGMARFLRFFGCRVVMCMHCKLLGSSRRKTKALAEAADYYLCVSDVIMNDLREIGVSEDKIIRFYPEYEYPPEESFERTDSSVLNVLYVGRIERNKGVFELMDAFQLAHKQFPLLRLVYCGNGSDLDMLKKVCVERNLEDRVEFFGHLDRDSLQICYHESDIVVVPTRSDFGEGFNKVVVEALLLEMPVITTNVCPSATEFEDFVHLITPDSSEAIYSELCEILINGSTRGHGFPTHWASIARNSFKDALFQVSGIPKPTIQLDENPLPEWVDRSKLFSHNPLVPSSLRVFVVVEQCNPEWPSVPRVAYQLLQATSTHLQMTVITHERNREAFLHAPFGDEVYFVKEPGWLARYYEYVVRWIPGGQENWPLLHALSYPLFDHFDRKATQLYDLLEASGEHWDLIWAMTPILPRYPFRLARRKSRAPFVLGPVNGGLPFPRGFLKRSFSEYSYFNFLRNFGECIAGLKKTYRSAEVVLAGSRYTLKLLQDRMSDRSNHAVYFPENGINDTYFSINPLKRNDRSPLALLYVGRLTAYKGCDMIIEAMANLPKEVKDRVSLQIVGTGSYESSLRKLVDKKKLQERVEFIGQVDPDRMSDIYQSSHLFCFPSIREFGGAVVLEAMAAGLPCVVPAYGGIGEYVSAETGFCGELGSRGDLVDFIRESIVTCFYNESFRQQKSERARESVRSFLWKEKGRRIVDCFHQLLTKMKDNQDAA